MEVATRGGGLHDSKAGVNSWLLGTPAIGYINSSGVRVSLSIRASFRKFAMSSRSGRSTGALGDDANSQGGHLQEGSSRGGPSIVVNAISLAAELAGRLQLEEAVEEYVAASERELVLLRQINICLEQQVVVLEEQVAILTHHLRLRRREGP